MRIQEVRAWLTSRRGRRTRTLVVENKRCPECSSYYIARKYSGWEFDEQGNRTRHVIGSKRICPYCQRLTVQDPWIPDNDNREVVIRPYIPDWVRCPNCGIRFSLRSRSWNGQRHTTCGQRLEIEQTS